MLYTRTLNTDLIDWNRSVAAFLERYDSST